MEQIVLLLMHSQMTLHFNSLNYLVIADYVFLQFIIPFLAMQAFYSLSVKMKGLTSPPKKIIRKSWQTFKRPCFPSRTSSCYVIMYSKQVFCRQSWRVWVREALELLTGDVSEDQAATVPTTAQSHCHIVFNKNTIWVVNCCTTFIQKLKWYSQNSFLTSAEKPRIKNRY